MKDGKIFNKFPTNEKFLKNKISGAQDLSLKAPVSNTFKPINGVSDDNILPFRDVVVNSELPHVSSLYEGLTPWQMGQLDKALKTGLSKTDMKAGSLESLNKVKQEINEMISKAQATDRPSEVWQLQELKSKFDNAMPEGLKEVDAGFARAKRLEDAFERNEHYNPNFVGFPLNNGWFVDNPLLSAGLSSTAFNNLRNR